MKKLYWIYTTAFGLLVFGMMGFTAVTSSGVEDSTKNSSDKQSKKIKWHTFDKGVELAAKEDKMLVVDFYTDWCHWCKVMDKETFASRQVVDFAQKNVIMAKINAETTEKFAYRNAKYSGRQLSQMFGIRGFPTTVFLDANGDLITTVSGYIPPERFTLILKYLSGEWYDKMKFDEFLKKEQVKNKG